jgi:hypothetical protein
MSNLRRIRASANVHGCALCVFGDTNPVLFCCFLVHLPKGSRVCCENEVACHGQLAAAAQGEAVDCSDDRFANLWT